MPYAICSGVKCAFVQHWGPGSYTPAKRCPFCGSPVILACPSCGVPLESKGPACSQCQAALKR